MRKRWTKQEGEYLAAMALACGTGTKFAQLVDRINADVSRVFAVGVDRSIKSVSIELDRIQMAANGFIYHGDLPGGEINDSVIARNNTRRAWVDAVGGAVSSDVVTLDPKSWVIIKGSDRAEGSTKQGDGSSRLLSGATVVLQRKQTTLANILNDTAKRYAFLQSKKPWNESAWMRLLKEYNKHRSVLKLPTIKMNALKRYFGYTPQQTQQHGTTIPKQLIEYLYSVK